MCMCVCMRKRERGNVYVRVHACMHACVCVMHAASKCFLCVHLLVSVNCNTMHAYMCACL